MVKLNTVYFSLILCLATSCSQVESNSDIIHLNLERSTSLKLVNCFHKEQPKPDEIDDPYINQCLSMAVDQETLTKFKNEINESLKEKGWSLSETIEKTEIYRKIRSYDKCLFTVHVSEESSQYTQDYFTRSDSRQLYNGKYPTLIITRFTEPSCS